MPCARRLSALLVSVALAAAPAGAWAQGAGDEDPFAGTDTAQPTIDAPSDAPPLTSTPQGDDGADPSPAAPPPAGEAGTAAGSGSSSDAAGTAGAATSRQVDELPRTGLDTRAVVLLGLALTLAGIGLRLRTADERF